MCSFAAGHQIHGKLRSLTGHSREQAILLSLSRSLSLPPSLPLFLTHTHTHTFACSLSLSLRVPTACTACPLPAHTPARDPRRRMSHLIVLVDGGTLGNQSFHSRDVALESRLAHQGYKLVLRRLAHARTFHHHPATARYHIRFHRCNTSGPCIAALCLSAPCNAHVRHGSVPSLGACALASGELSERWRMCTQPRKIPRRRQERKETHRPHDRVKRVIDLPPVARLAAPHPLWQLRGPLLGNF